MRKLLGGKWDGRYFLFGSHITLFAVGYFKFHLERTALQMALAYGAACAMELFFHFSLRKYKFASVTDRMLSASAEAAGILILVNTAVWYQHALVAFVAVASKYLLIDARGRHVFNPTNIGILAVLAFNPHPGISIHPDEFTLHTYSILHVVAFGTVATFLAGTYRVTLAYFVTVGLLGLAAQQILGPSGFMENVAPSLGALGMIFAFLMITDPKTTPASAKGQLAFGASIAVTMFVLRSFEVCYESFVALFLITWLRFCVGYARTALSGGASKSGAAGEGLLRSA